MVILKIPFALYRMPNQDHMNLIVQNDFKVENVTSFKDLQQQSGFLLAPFALNADHPMAVIRPDITFSDNQAIEEFLSSGAPSLKHMDANLELPPLGSKESLCFRKPLQEEDACFERYQGIFDTFITALKERRFDKLVLSRPEQYGFAPFDLYGSFVKACELYPNMMISLVNTEGTGTWFGTTPEILIQGEGDQFTTMSLAGTMKLASYRSALKEKAAANRGSNCSCGSSDDFDKAIPTLDDWSSKDIEEQGYVTSYIEQVLSKYSSKIVKNGPMTAPAGPVCHLKTDFNFTLDNTDNLGELIGALHPTPAVCGLPKLEAYDFIINNEGYDRAYYAGVIGPINYQGQTKLYVNLRCMRLERDANESKITKATCFIGGGILRQSDVKAEFDEGSNKVETILAAVSDRAYQERINQ